MSQTDAVEGGCTRINCFLSLFGVVKSTQVYLNINHWRRRWKNHEHNIHICLTFGMVLHHLLNVLVLQRRYDAAE